MYKTPENRIDVNILINKILLCCQNPLICLLKTNGINDISDEPTYGFKRKVEVAQIHIGFMDFIGKSVNLYFSYVILMYLPYMV